MLFTLSLGIAALTVPRVYIYIYLYVYTGWSNNQRHSPF
jgi:hypothetical protein